MVTSSWTDIQPNIRTVPTKKKFFSGYLYKLVVWAPGTRLVNSKPGSDLARLLEDRIRHLSVIYNSYSWRVHEIKELTENGRAEQLQYYANVKQRYKGQVKIRVEEPTLSLYCDSEYTLKEIAENASFKERITEIHRPCNEQAADALNRGEIVVKTVPKYQYKIVFKEAWTMGADVKRSISDYLYNLEDEVKMTKGLTRQLGSARPWFPGGYFYSNDTKVTTFLNLISPGCISGIYKLTKVDE